MEADQQRGQLADDKGRLQAEVDRLRGQVTMAEGPHQDEARRREAAEKAAEDKDAELKAALAKPADLERALQERDHAIERERRGTLLEAQHLEESFSSKCFSCVWPGRGPVFHPWNFSSDMLRLLCQGSSWRRSGWRRNPSAFSAT